MGEYFDAETGASSETCPDGRVNAWEATVPNGVYIVTAALATTHAVASGCTIENVRTHLTQQSGGVQSGGVMDTHVYSVEVSDGRFTLSSSGGPVTPFSLHFARFSLFFLLVHFWQIALPPFGGVAAIYHRPLGG